MNECIVLLLFLFSLSALVPPTLNIYISLAILLPFALLNGRKPDGLTILLCIYLGVIFLFQLFFNTQDYVYFNPQIAFSFFILQNCIILGSALSSAGIVFSDKDLLQVRKNFDNIQKLSLLVLLVFPLIKITFVLFSYGGLRFPVDLPSAVGLLIFDSPETLSSLNVYDSETLTIFPRFILSKASLSFLFIYAAAWLCSSVKSNKALCLSLLIVASLSIGFRLAFFAVANLFIFSFMLRSRNSFSFMSWKKNLSSLALPFIKGATALPLVAPFLLLFFDRSFVVKHFDRFPSFLAAIDYSTNVNVLGASFGSYWHYTDKHLDALSQKFGANIGDVFLGTELFASELITSLGFAGAIVFSIYYLYRIYSNVESMISNYSIIPAVQKQLVFLQIGVALAAIGGAVNLIGIPFFLIAGWRLKPQQFKNKISVN